MKPIMQGFEVEWAHSLGKQPEGEFDPDKVQFSFRDFADKASAMRFAKQVLPKVAIGDVRITQFHLENYEYDYPPYQKEYDREPEFISEG